MAEVTLKTHKVYNAKEISKLSSHEKVQDALGLSAEHTSVEGTEAFINFVNEQELQDNVYSRQMS
ncbi:hypothetical protein HUG20_08445 [Salicibibacter cibi]|uniref:Uncharacterized protein n=1 Tax=Salicibibacter cibi TaxID=2743001 RepID=A0A7T7CF99_9BACI|nr:hypothetical protein [Salicibibacter cibi]QQK79910.1 hypothetical protein HUG20_08445 [Salicibibacter cibi]